MLPRKARLTSGDLRVFRGEKAAPSPLFTVQVRQNNSGRNRFAIIVGANVDRRSVVRNTIRRRIAHSVAQWPNKGMDTRIIVLPAAKAASFRAIAQEINKVLHTLTPKPQSHTNGLPL